MPDGSFNASFPPSTDGHVPASPQLMDNSRKGLRARASADGILISMCQNVCLTAEKLNVAATGCVVHLKETAEQSATRLASAMDHLLACIAETPATTVAGLRAKADIVTQFCDDEVALSLAKDLAGRKPIPKLKGALTPDPVASEEDLFQRYNAWLFNERQMLLIDRYGIEGAEEAARFVPCVRHDMHFHGAESWDKQPRPMSRAADVMSVAGAFMGPDYAMSPHQIAEEAAAQKRFAETGSAV